MDAGKAKRLQTGVLKLSFICRWEREFTTATHQTLLLIFIGFGRQKRHITSKFAQMGKRFDEGFRHGTYLKETDSL